MSTFETFDWEASKEWKTYEDNLLIPPGPDYERLLNNRKQRWYKTNIDAEYQTKEIPPKTQTNSNTTNTQTNTNSTNAKENQTANQSTNKPYDSNRSSQSTSKSTSTPPSQSNSRVGGWDIAKITSYTQLTLHSITLVSSLFLLLPFFGETLRSISFSAILFSSIVTLTLSIARTHGRPQLNQQMALKLARDENCHFLFYTIILFAASHAFIYVLPFVVRSAVFICAALPRILPQQMYSKIEAPLVAITTQCMHLQRSNALFEILAFGYSLMNLFTAQRSFVLVLLQFQYLRIRAMLSSESQVAWQQVGGITDSLFDKPWMPQQIRALYYRARTYLSNSMAPPAQAG